MAQNDEEPSQVLSFEGPAVVEPSSIPSAFAKSEATLDLPATANLLTNKCSDLSKNGIVFPKAKNYKAGSKINQLADRLAKRSLQAVEASENGEEPSPSLLPSSVLPILPPPALEKPSDEPVERVKTEESPTAVIPSPAAVPPPTPPPPPLSPAEPVQTDPVGPLSSPPSTAFNDSQDSTKEKPIKTRTSPRCRKEVDLNQTDSVVKRGKTKKQVRRSKNLVEMSTQTAEIQFISIVKDDEAAPVTELLTLPEDPPPLTLAPVELPPLTVEPPSEPPPLTPPEPLPLSRPTFICFFCHLTFLDKTDCLNHEATHSLKRKTKFIKCQFCIKKLPNLEEFKSHLTKHHGPNFHLCTECDLRFLNPESLALHTKLDHPADPVEKTQFTILNKKVRIGPCLDIDVSFDAGRKPSISPRITQKLSPKDKTEEQLYEAEMLFYSHLSGNIQENLSKHLDGKIDQYDSTSDAVEPMRNSYVLTVVPSSSGPATMPPRAPSPYQTRSKTPNPLPTSAKKFKKLPNWQQKFWEKYNFPTNYRFEHRFWDKNYIHTEKSPLYLKDLSCLDIKTQLTMRENVKKLEDAAKVTKDDSDRLSFPHFLNLEPKVVRIPAATETSTTSKVELVKIPKKKGGKVPRRSRAAAEGPTPQVVTRRQSGMDGASQRKGSLDLGPEKTMTLRRQTSLDNLEPGREGVAADEANGSSKDGGDLTDANWDTSVISGEWVRPRSYLCGTCCAKFSNLWELEDHKWATHPNVWCTHYEFEDDKLEKLFQLEAVNPQIAQITLPDLYRRHLRPQGSLCRADTVATTAFPHPCSKCLKPCTSQPELHKHMLDCGGDTTWLLTMCSSPATMKRRWRPYGSRRRKQIGQRGVKRNIPATNNLRSYCTPPKIRTKPGDMESIQKMLANLPEKRTRRAINFDEVNTRSQTTIRSNRLLRKRFNVTFGSNYLRRKVLTTVRHSQLQGSGQSSKNTSDNSSDTTPSSSPRRRYRLKEVSVAVTPLALSPAMFPPKEEEETSVKKTSATKKKKKKVQANKTEKVAAVKPAAVEEKLSEVAEQIKFKKKMVERKGYLVKRIKKKLKNSKKLMEVRAENRRRSVRLKESQVKEEEEESGEFTVEESVLPIAKLSVKKKPVNKKKAAAAPANPEMPILDREEPVKKRLCRKTDQDLPVLKPFEEQLKNQVEEFKVVTKLKKKPISTAKVSPLKLVKKVREAKPTESATEVETPVEDLTTDSVPLSTLKKPLLIRKKRAVHKWTKIKRKPKVIPKEEENIDKEHVPEESETDGGCKPVAVEPETEVTNAKQEIFTNLMVEQIITDKLNEKVIKRSKNLVHRRNKGQRKHGLKRLRMTVTLKEATLKVLDKPSPVSGPNKWSLSSPTSEIISFDPAPAIVPEQIAVAPSPEVTEPVPEEKDEEVVEIVTSKNEDKIIEISTPKTRLRRRVSKNESPVENSIENIKVEENCPSSSNGTSNGLTDSSSNEKGQEVKEVEQTKKRRKSKTFLEETAKIDQTELKKVTEVPETPPEASQDLSDHWKESDVSTTVASSEEKEVVVLNLRTRKTSKQETIKFEDTLECAQPIIPIFTIEEATSSEDATTSKPTRAASYEPRIAEADSTGEKIVCQETCDVPDIKIEPEMVVSSTGPVGGKIERRKRKSREVAVDFESKDEVSTSTLVIPEELDRRSRRKSKEVRSTNEFIIDDPLLLVDELWSDLDSDSDSQPKKKLRRIKKRSPKKKAVEKEKTVDLEALLRNFGENKDEIKDEEVIKTLPRKREKAMGLSSRQRIENKSVINENSWKRLSLRLISFKRKVLRYGHHGQKLLKVKKILLETVAIPKLPFLPSEVTENPEQVIVCRATKPKVGKKLIEEGDKKPVNPQLKVSLPLELIGDLTVLNNNQLRAPVPLPSPQPIVDLLKAETSSRCSSPEVKSVEPKQKRSEVIDKIFYCEICKTYYYSPSQLKNHKMSNRHKLKEAELLEEGSDEILLVSETFKLREETKVLANPPVDKVGDDTSEMPVLEGPFIETRLETRTEPLPTPHQQTVFGFSEESLKDIQKAIGCTDEEMLILTLLGENTVPEPDILDISNMTSKAEALKDEKSDSAAKSGKTNGTTKVDLKQRMTTALASLVNRAVSNLLTKSETATKPTERSDAVSFLNKLSGFSGRKKSVAPVDLPAEEEASLPIPVPLAPDYSEVRYKHQCTICGNRFEKESTRDFHLVRTHRVGKKSKAAMKQGHEEVPPSEEWNESWYECEDFSAAPSSQFWCSECGINFLSPKEVLEHQRAEHPPEPTRATEEAAEPQKTTQRRVSGLDPDQERILANQELQKLDRRQYRRLRGRKSHFGVDAVKFTKTEPEVRPKPKKPEPEVVPVSKTKESPKCESVPISKMVDRVVSQNENKKSVDVYDFNEFDSEPEPVVFEHVKKVLGKGSDENAEDEADEDEDNLPLSSVIVPRPEEPTSHSEPDENNKSSEQGKESFKISLQNRFLKLDEISLKKSTLSGSEEDSLPLFALSKKDSVPDISPPKTDLPHEESDEEVSENVIYQRNDSVSSFESHDEDLTMPLSESEEVSSKSESEESEEEEASTTTRRQKKIVPLLTATLTNTERKSESPKINKEVIVKKIWSRKKLTAVHDESADIDKEAIVNRVWKKKKKQAMEEAERTTEEVPINQTEFSDEVVIKCGPKPKHINRRRSDNENAKDAIVRKIWSGKCGFQTKAALKTYDSDVLPLPLPEPVAETSPIIQQNLTSPAKRRGRPASMSALKRKRTNNASEDDLDSLLDEIEQENFEKAIRSEFLHLRRSEKNTESPKEPAGLFAEIQPPEVRNTPEKKKRKIRKNVSLLKRRQEINDFRNRHHKKHRHRHHHHKHKHKKSRHHKKIVLKHRNRHMAELEPELADGSAPPVDLEPFRVLERMCEDIPPRFDVSPIARRVGADKLNEPRISSDLDNLDLKLDEILSPYECPNRVNGDVSDEDYEIPSKNGLQFPTT